MIIGIVGHIGNGKSTVAKWLVENRDFKEYAFAEPLKQIAQILGFEYKQVYGTQNEKLEINKLWGVSGREFMQKFGTNICRNKLPQEFPFLKSTLWVSLFEQMIINNPAMNYVISDIRLPDEYKSVKQKNGIVIRVSRTKYNNRGAGNNHESEKYVDTFECDYVIQNDGTLQDLYNKLDILMEKIK